MKIRILIFLGIIFISVNSFGEKLDNGDINSIEVKKEEVKYENIASKELDNQEIKKEEIKSEFEKNEEKKKREGNVIEAKKKKISGISPLLLITLLCQDDDADDSSITLNGEDIPIIGSFYEGNINGNREKLYGIGFNTSKDIEFIYQKRKYYNKDECEGFFTGSIITAGINSMRTYIEKDSNGRETVYISNSEGKKVYSWGIRVGGNIGCRFKVGNSGTYISTRTGLALPLHFISGGLDYNAEQKRELYLTNAFYKMWDFGLHIEYIF